MRTALLALAALVCRAESFTNIFSQVGTTHTFSELAISPDGSWMAWVEDKSGYTLHRGSEPVRLNEPSITSFAFSPDNNQLAFLSKDAAGQRNIFVQTLTANSPAQITHLNGYAEGLHWTPDGQRLSFLYAEGGHGGGPLHPHAAQVGEIGAEIRNQRVTTIAPDGSGLHPITPANLNIYEYAWSPRGDSLAVTAAPGPADNNWWIAKLYTVDAVAGTMKLLYSPPAERQIAEPRWSPDSTHIAFVGGIMSDEGFDGGDLWIADVQTGAVHDATPGSKISVAEAVWTSPEELLLSEFQDGGGAFGRLDLRSSKTTGLWSGPNLPTVAFSSDGTQSLIINSDWQHPPELYAGEIGAWTQVTHANASLHPLWGKAESLRWHSDSFRPQGWLLYPRDFDPSRRYPMIVSVHGGPASERENQWPTTHFDMSLFAATGYFVFFPNPRGSYGQGETFTLANRKDFGGGDLRDILAGVDEVLRHVPVDPSRIGIAGWSYGGYMTMWAVTQTNRFHAAIAGAGIANWLSYYGENLIDRWMIPYFGASVYDDRAAYAKASPIDYIKRAKTPSLILVGEFDSECPAPQSFEFWHALSTLGVPANLVVYAGEGHAFDRDADQLDRMRRTSQWFEKYLSQPSVIK